MKKIISICVAVASAVALANNCYTFQEFSNCPGPACPGEYFWTGVCQVVFCEEGSECWDSQTGLDWNAFKRTRDKGYYTVGQNIVSCYGAIRDDDVWVGCCDCSGARSFISIPPD